MSVLTLHKNFDSLLGDRARNADFSHDEKLLCVTSYDAKSYIFDVVDDFTLVDTLDFSLEKNRSLSWSYNGQLLAIGAEDDNVYIFNVSDLGSNAEPVATLEIGNGRINGIQFSKDDNWLAAADDTGRVIIVDVTDSYAVERVFDTGIAAAYGLRWSRKNEWLAVTRGATDEIYIFDTSDSDPANWSLDYTIGGTGIESAACSSIDWIKDDTIMVSAHRGVLRVWDVTNSFNELSSIDSAWENERLWRTRGDEMSRFVVYGAVTGSIVLDVEDNNPANWSTLQTVTDGTADRHALAWSLTDNWFVVGTRMSGIYIYKVEQPPKSVVNSIFGELTTQDGILISK